jgi:hypothetical protein
MYMWIKIQNCHGKNSIQQENSLHQQIDLKFKEETNEVLHLECSLLGCWNLDTSESRSETPGKFWNVVLEKDGEDQLDRSCEKWGSITYSQGAYNKIKEIYMDWWHFAYELDSKTGYLRKDRSRNKSDGNRRM